MNNVILPVEMTPEQIQAMNLHSLFKHKRVYDSIDKEDDFDTIQVWFEVSYNVCTYNVEPVYFDLIKDGEVIKKIKPYNRSEFEIQEYSGTEYEMQSFTINKNML